MKKRIIIFITACILIISSSSAFSYGNLGDFRGADSYYYDTGFGVISIYMMYFQFGTIIRGFGGGDIIYYYGEGDLPGRTKKSLDITYEGQNINYDHLVNVNVYEAQNLANPTSIKHLLVNKKDNYGLENLNLNLEENKLYIIVFRDESGAVLNVKKIVKTN